MIGNNAVHPGQIDLKDDNATALGLFVLLNLIIERNTAVPKRIETLYATLPETALEAIERRKRDQKKSWFVLVARKSVGKREDSD